MGGLLLLLVPEIVGLMITPGAVIGCVLLLRSCFPVRNAAAFGAGFLVVYLLVALSAVLGGASDPAATPARVSHGAGLAVGLLFLACGCWMWLRKPRTAAERPRLLTELETAGPRKSFAIGLVLGVLNPNLFIMMSGMSVISSSAVAIGAALVATAALLLAASADFLIPIGAYLIAGDRADRGLAVVEAWMLRNSRTLTLSVLFGFGALFTVRGVVDLWG
ncbi:GAP family protein [Nocardia sp. AG03]|uniref:GAP family protein n=1 Tax=Nocardia sp. AG03 TaxID=3025312 RepID=UPI002418BB7E|nr:GAP family protein [Nocardia sp. AG03]